MDPELIIPHLNILLSQQPTSPGGCEHAKQRPTERPVKLTDERTFEGHTGVIGGAESSQVGRCLAVLDSVRRFASFCQLLHQMLNAAVTPLDLFPALFNGIGHLERLIGICRA